MRQRLKEELLRQYVREMLHEDAVDMGGYPGAMEMMAASPYGMSFGSQEDLVNTFITPFTDVFKTAVGKTKELARKTKTLLGVSISTILTTVIPFYGYDYADVFDKEKADIEKIRSEYKDVYDRTEKALKSGDAQFLAFLASPAVVIGAYAAKGTPKAAKELLSTVSGGWSDELYDKAKLVLKKAERKALGDTHVSRNFSKDDEEPKTKRSTKKETYIREARDEKSEDLTKKIMTNKSFLEKALASPKSMQMQAAATKIYRKSLQRIHAQAENALKKTRTIDDVEKAAKKKIPEAEKIRKLPPEERQKAEKMLVDGIRKAMKEFYVKNLTDHVESVVKAGVPEEAQFVKDYRETIQKIKAM